MHACSVRTFSAAQMSVVLANWGEGGEGESPFPSKENMPRTLPADSTTPICLHERPTSNDPFTTLYNITAVYSGRSGEWRIEQRV